MKHLQCKLGSNQHLTWNLTQMHNYRYSVTSTIRVCILVKEFFVCTLTLNSVF